MSHGDWLQTLPHQIPFRAASSVTRMDDTSIEGRFLWTASDPLTAGSPAIPWMIFEAMAQFGGGLAFRDQGGHGYLTAIDNASIDRPIEAGQAFNLHVRLEAEFGGIFRFQGVATLEGVECARARFYLAKESGVRGQGR